MGHILVVLLYDEEGTLGQGLAELAVLDESVSEEDRARFGNLIAAHGEKMRQVVRSQVESMIKKRLYITGCSEEIEAHRLSRAATELFSKIYRSPLTFPFDGFGTTGGTNGPLDCQSLTMELLVGKLDYDAVMAKPIRLKNRAIKVLKDGWGVFAQNGNVRTRPTQPVVRSLTEKWDDMLFSGERMLPVGTVLRQLCAPPYGANIASAGLFLGAFIAPRADKLAVLRDGEPLTITQWVQEALFRGKFIDMAALHDVAIVPIGEASSEWETLLDEWEQADNHLAKRNCLERATELKNRVPVPPSLAYREVHLREQASGAVNALAHMDEDQSEAISKIEQGIERRDVSLLSWGAAEIKKLADKMIAEKPLWIDTQVAEVQPHYERARQAVILLLPDWLPRQAPKSDAPVDVGNFQHKMLHLFGGNLKNIGLEAECQQVEAYTLQVIRKAQTIAEAHQLLRDVQSWLTTHGDATRIVRVAHLRALRDVGKEYASKLQGMSEQISLTEIGSTRTQLSTFLTKLKDAETEAVKRASALWQTKLRSEDDIERILTDVQSLVGVFDNLPTDQDDLLLMRRALRLYQKDYQQLANERLTWPEFEKLAEQLRQDAGSTFGKEDIPWSPEDAIGGFVASITKQRKDASVAWIDALEPEAAGVASMSAADANRLHARADNPPAILTEPHAKRLKKVVKDIETRLDALKIDWLVEKFKELPVPLQKRFLRLVAEDGNGCGRAGTATSLRSPEKGRMKPAP